MRARPRPESPASTAGRLLVPDVLRGVAIVAMLVGHAVPFMHDAPSAVDFAAYSMNALASPLFALVMGMSMQLVWNHSPRPGEVMRQQLIRGAVLIVLGLWMMTWGSWAVIVLAYLGVLLIVGAPLLRCSTRTIVILTAVLLAISQPLSRLARTWTWLDEHPGAVLNVADWLFHGSSYRVFNLLPLFLIGGLLVRHGFRRDALLGAIAGGAIGLYAVSAVLQRLLFGAAPSGDYLDTASDLGTVLLVYVLVALVATMRTTRAAAARSMLFAPFQAWGRVALSLYMLHIAVIAVWIHLVMRSPGNDVIGWLVVVPGMLAVGWAWWAFVGTGPVEWLLGWVTGRPKRWRPTPADRSSASPRTDPACP